MRLSLTHRYNIFSYGVIVFCFFIILRLFQIQVLNSARYKAQAREQQWSEYHLSARRGNIYTSDGYPVALSETTYNLILNRREIDSSVNIFSELSKYIDPVKLDKKTISELSSDKRNWINIAQGITWSEKEAFEASEIVNKRKAFSFLPSYSRYYPEKNMLSNVLGFVGKDKLSNDIGYYGIEQYYDGDLRGQPGLLIQERSASGDPILWGGVDRIDSIDGSDLYLTIDHYVQFLVESKLKAGVERYGARSGTVIVIEPSTGHVIGMANYPNFDPKDYQNADSMDVLNRAISTTYEPGSVMKGITMSAAIDLGIVSPSTIYNDNGPKVFSGHKVDNWDGKHHGEETMIEVLQHSNNLGVAWVGTKVGGKALMEYFEDFSMGAYTNIDLDGEETGILYNNFPLKDIELVNASFGQGVAITPLQMAVAFSAIANDGILMKPMVVNKIVTNKKETIIKPVIGNRPISKKTADIMVDMLTQAVEGGEAKFFVSKKYKIAGKTGTAQIAVKGGYDKTKTNATFVGFFPTYKNFVMLVKLEEPTFPSGYSAETAVPLWMDIAEKLAGYYGLLPDKI